MTEPEAEHGHETTHGAVRESAFEQGFDAGYPSDQGYQSDAGYPSDQREADDDEIVDEAPEAVDPQQWIDRLTAVLEDAEHQFGPEHREAFKARVDLATAYRQIGEPGLAVPLAVRNTLQAGMLFPAGGGVPASLRKFQDEVCAEAGYTMSDVRLLESVEEQPAPVLVPDPVSVSSASSLSPVAEAEEIKAAGADTYVEYGDEHFVDHGAHGDHHVAHVERIDDTGRADRADRFEQATGRLERFEPFTVEVEAPVAPRAEAVVATAESELAYEVIRLRFELQEARRTIDRLRRRNAKLVDVLREDD